MTPYDITLDFTVALVIGLLLGSFVEYTVHRLMHKGKFLSKRHAKHHRNFEAQGWWGEFTDFSLPGLLIAWAGFLVSISAGIGFALGTVGYAAFAAYAHQIQHEKPEIAFWLGAPIHYLHHRENMWHHNFGIGVSIWDRMMGTYTLSGDSIGFSPMAGTMMACAEGAETERAFLAALGNVRTWRLLGRHLDFYDEAGELVARFEARLED